MLMSYRMLKFGSINCVHIARKRKYTFPSMYITIFVLLCTSESLKYTYVYLTLVRCKHCPLYISNILSNQLSPDKLKKQQH